MAETFLAHMKTTEGTVEPMRKGGPGNGLKCPGYIDEKGEHHKCGKLLGNRRNRSGARKTSFTGLCRSCWAKKHMMEIHKKKRA